MKATTASLAARPAERCARDHSSACACLDSRIGNVHDDDVTLEIRHEQVLASTRGNGYAVRVYAYVDSGHSKPID